MNKSVLIILGLMGIIALLFAGLLPLPGQKDNVTIHNQPSPPSQSSAPKTPTGPPHQQSGVDGPGK